MAKDTCENDLQIDGPLDDLEVEPESHDDLFASEEEGSDDDNWGSDEMNW